MCVSVTVAIFYDHMIMYVGLFGHSAVVFHVFFNVLLTVWLCFSVNFIDLFSCITASLFNKLTYLLPPTLEVTETKCIWSRPTFATIFFIFRWALLSAKFKVETERKVWM